MIQYEEMAEIKQEVDDEDHQQPAHSVSEIVFKQEPEFEADGNYGYTQSLTMEVQMCANKRRQSHGHSAAAWPDLSLGDPDIMPEDGSIGVTVMEQDTNGALVMVLRNPQFSSSCDVSHHPVVRPAGVSKKQAEFKVFPDSQVVVSQTGKTAALTRDEQIVQEDVKPYLCGVCDMCFTDISDLNKHTKQHTEERLYMNDAGFTHHTDIKAENLQTNETLYTCDVCGAQLTSENLLREHMERHPEGNGCKCCDCGLESVYCKCLKTHPGICRGGTQDESGDCGQRPTDASVLEAQQSQSPGDKRYSCDFCGLEFSVVSDLKAHKRTHADQSYRCEVCDMKFSNRTSLATHQSIHTGERAYKCGFCGLGFAYKSHLKRHVMIHTGDRPYKCGICGTKFTRSFSLKIHERIHTGQKPYKCDVCGQEFTNNGCLKRHAGTHTGEKPYKCDICDVRYAFRSYLKIHKRTHTGEKPFKCDVCGVEFTDNRCLKRHTGIHTGIPRKMYGAARTGEKPFKCGTCDAKFAFQRYLKVHERVHTGEKPYKCDVCDSRFSHVHTMKEHQRIHTGEKPYTCHICNLGFTYKSHLTRHVITHTGERPYKCDKCGITFTQSSSLNRHKGVHKDKVVV